MNTTIPCATEFEVAETNDAYERLRLGIGLRLKDAARLAWLVLVTAMLAFGCAVRTDPTEPEQTPVAVSHGQANGDTCDFSGMHGCFAGSGETCVAGKCTSVTIAWDNCSVGTAESGMDPKLCSANVNAVMSDPIIVRCSTQHERPPTSLVGNSVCEPGAFGVWCCVGMPAVGSAQ